MRRFTRWVCVLAGLLLLVWLSGRLVRAQAGAGRAAASAAPAAQPEPARDTLGRETPRKTVLGFINAARKGNNEILPAYLDTNLQGQAAVDLARKLFVVLDSRLPARLNELSDRPEGSSENPLKPDENIVGTINMSGSSFDVVVERITRGTSGPIWLFSRKTLASIPDAYAEIDLVVVDRFVPRHPGQASNRRHPSLRVARAACRPARSATGCWDRSTGRFDRSCGSGAAGPGSAAAIPTAMCRGWFAS